MESKEKVGPDHEIRCSNACTRAGTSVLVLSLFAFSLLPLLTRHEAAEALNRYGALRFSLKSNLDQLLSEPCWKTLNSDGRAEKEWPLWKIMEYSCLKSVKHKPWKSAHEESRREPKHKASVALEPPAAPGPPQIRIVADLLPYFAGEVLKNLTALEDEKLLSQARLVADAWIYRWLVQRRKVYTEVVFSTAAGKTPENMTVDQIREIAEFDLPQMGKLSIVRNDTRENIGLLPMTIAVSLVPATGCIGLALLVSLGYFWLFLSEAKLSQSYPAPGTLFGVFRRWRWRRVMFLVLITVPAGAVGGLAWWSFNLAWWNTIIAASVFFVCLLIAHEFLSENSSASRMRGEMERNFSDPRPVLEDERDHGNLSKPAEESLPRKDGEKL